MGTGDVPRFNKPVQIVLFHSQRPFLMPALTGTVDHGPFMQPETAETRRPVIGGIEQPGYVGEGITPVFR